MRVGPGNYLVAMLLLGACTATTTSDSATIVGNVPEAVMQLAGPNQDITTARLLREDNCYWYEHVGPVETTLLPLRTAGGNTICVTPEG